MAIDKAIDSGKLDNALTATADAIRVKTGDTADIAFDYSGETGFANAVEAISSGGKVESGTFTISSDTKVVTLNHELGEIPSYCIVYPINVPKATATYRICYEVLLFNIGQEDFNISSKDGVFRGNHGMWTGVGYVMTAVGQNDGHNLPVQALGVTYAGSATATTVTVGGLNQTSAGGTLTAGTFGYILGVI